MPQRPLDFKKPRTCQKYLQTSDGLEFKSPKYYKGALISRQLALFLAKVLPRLQFLSLDCQIIFHIKF